MRWASFRKLAGHEPGGEIGHARDARHAADHPGQRAGRRGRSRTGVSADVSVSAVSDSSALDNNPDARSPAAQQSLPAPPCAPAGELPQPAAGQPPPESSRAAGRDPGRSATGRRGRARAPAHQPFRQAAKQKKPKKTQEDRPGDPAAAPTEPNGRRSGAGYYSGSDTKAPATAPSRLPRGPPAAK